MSDEKPELPPREVAQGLTPAEYYKLGLQYKRLGWIEQARTALTRAIEGDANGETGRLAKTYLQTKIPLLTVSAEAQRENIRGFNHMYKGDWAAAKQVLEQAIVDYPNFEWLYGNLARVLLKEGQIERAKEVLTKALALNPSYLNGWLQLAAAKIQERDLAGALDCVEKALALDPEEPFARAAKAEHERNKQSS